MKDQVIQLFNANRENNIWCINQHHSDGCLLNKSDHLKEAMKLMISDEGLKEFEKAMADKINQEDPELAIMDLVEWAGSQALLRNYCKDYSYAMQQASMQNQAYAAGLSNKGGAQPRAAYIK